MELKLRSLVEKNVMLAKKREEGRKFVMRQDDYSS